MAVLAVLQVIGALFMLLGAAGFGIISSLGLGGLLSAIAGFSGWILVISAVILLVSAYGLWSGTPWGWWLNMVVAVLTIIFTFATIVGIAIGLIILYYLTRPNVRNWFRV